MAVSASRATSLLKRTMPRHSRPSAYSDQLTRPVLGTWDAQGVHHSHLPAAQPAGPRVCVVPAQAPVVATAIATILSLRAPVGPFFSSPTHPCAALVSVSRSRAVYDGQTVMTFARVALRQRPCGSHLPSSTARGEPSFHSKMRRMSWRASRMRRLNRSASVFLHDFLLETWKKSWAPHAHTRGARKGGSACRHIPKSACAPLPRPRAPRHRWRPCTRRRSRRR
jgi:hypothetical protein